MHIVGSYLNALSSFESKRKISKSVAVEMLLFAAQTRQINLAIEKVGAQSSKEILLFAENEAALKPIKKHLSEERPFNPDDKHRKEAAKRLGLDPNISDIVLLQTIAISRLSY